MKDGKYNFFVVYHNYIQVLWLLSAIAVMVLATLCFMIGPICGIALWMIFAWIGPVVWALALLIMVPAHYFFDEVNGYSNQIAIVGAAKVWIYSLSYWAFFLFNLYCYRKARKIDPSTPWIAGWNS